MKLIKVQIDGSNVPLLADVQRMPEILMNECIWVDECSLKVILNRTTYTHLLSYAMNV